MNNKLLTFAFVLIVAVLLSGTVSAADNDYSASEDIVADDLLTTTSSDAALPDPYVVETGMSFTTIQAAIDSTFTQAGMTILVEAGTYNEDVLVWKDLTIIGAGTDSTFVNSFYITSAGSGSDISGFMVTGGTGEAIMLDGADGCNIHDNIISGGYSSGVVLYEADNNDILNNTIDDSIGANYYGIYLWNSHNNYIYNNTIAASVYDGVYLEESDYNDIASNNIVENFRYGIRSEESGNNWIYSNFISNNILDGVYLENSDSNTIYYNEILSNIVNGVRLRNSNYNIINSNQINNNNADGVNLENSHYNEIYTNNIQSNSNDGVYLYNSDSNKIYSNQIDNSVEGVYLANSEYNQIYNNQIETNEYAGVRVLGSDNNTVYSNKIFDNGFGVLLQHSLNSEVYNNEILYNHGGIVLIGDKAPSYSDINTNIINYNNFGISLSDSNNNTINQNEIYFNGYGLSMDCSDNNQIYNNQINNNSNDGVNLLSSEYNQIYSNEINNNSGDGVELFKSDYNEIYTNEIENNTDLAGVFLWYSTNNYIHSNYIKNNVNGVQNNFSDYNYIYSNTIINNELGMTMFASIYTQIYSNQITNNLLKGIYISQGNYNSIYENEISYNGENGVDIMGADIYSNNVSLFENSITNNSNSGVFISVGISNIIMNFNRIVDNGIFNVDNYCTGSVDATLNWWGYNDEVNITSQINDPNQTLDYGPWMKLSINATPTNVGVGDTSIITADLLHDSNGIYHDPTIAAVPYLGWAYFTTTKGTITDHAFSNGSATSTLTNLTTAGTATVSSTVDHQTVSVNVLVSAVPTIAQIAAAAGQVKLFYEFNGVLPANVLVGSQLVTMPQFLQLLVTATVNISQGNLNPVNIMAVANPTHPSGTYSHGNLYKNSYIIVARNIKNFIDSNGRAPNYAQTSLGKIPFAKLVYMYSKVINFYGQYLRLPNYVYI